MECPMTVKLAQTADETLVAEILASWSIEEIRQLIKEIEAELRHRRAPPRGAPRSRRLMPRVDRADARTARADHPATRSSAHAALAAIRLRRWLSEMKSLEIFGIIWMLGI
jgi:hypothetical protein